jgi:hypothetical protein
MFRGTGNSDQLCQRSKFRNGGGGWRLNTPNPPLGTILGIASVVVESEDGDLLIWGPILYTNIG